MNALNVQNLVESRGNIEFVAQVLKLLAKEALETQEIEKLSTILLHLKEMLDKTALDMFLLEAELDDVPCLEKDKKAVDELSIEEENKSQKLKKCG